jgi:hypothetical protein
MSDGPKPIGPTEHLNTVEYWRDNYMTLLEVAKEREEERDALLYQGIEAVRLTREYVHAKMLPAVEGWSWFDFVVKAQKALGLTNEWWNDPSHTGERISRADDEIPQTPYTPSSSAPTGLTKNEEIATLRAKIDQVLALYECDSGVTYNASCIGCRTRAILESSSAPTPEMES